MYTLRQRLARLFLFNLAIGFMFHYAIVFPYMDILGFSTSQLVMYAVITYAVIMIVEIPSGIIADRWSRKGILLISLVSMAIGCLLMSRADTFGQFMFAVIFTGIHFGMSSGVQAAILYDMLLEYKDRKSYEKILGRLNSVRTIGYIISSIAGAVIASIFNFQLAFYLSVVSCVVAFLILLTFKEPKLHREVESVKLAKHLVDLYKLLIKHPETRVLVLTSMLIGILVAFMQDVDPLWPIALGLATIFYGPLNALLLSSYALSGVIAGFASTKVWLARALGLGVFLATVGLVVENIYVIVASQFMLIACAMTLSVVLSGRIQDSLPSSQRSGSESAVGTLSGLSFVAMLPLFTYIAESQSIFVASWILVCVALMALVGMGRVFKAS